MKTLFKAMTLAAASLTALTVVTVPAAAQSTGGVAVADLQEAVRRTTAFTTASTQMKTTYATQITAYETRGKALQAEIAPLATAFENARKAPNANQTALQTQYNALQTKQQSAQAELQRLSLPIARAQAYVEEQIAGPDGAKLNTALKAAMTARGVGLVVAPQATISYQPTADLTAAITAELNKATPTASITPPANWQPGGAAAAPAAAATTPKPQGR